MRLRIIRTPPQISGGADGRSVGGDEEGGIWRSRAGRYVQGCFNTTADADEAGRAMTLANVQVPSDCLFMTLITVPY